jgi:hypothetical protein
LGIRIWNFLLNLNPAPGNHKIWKGTYKHRYFCGRSEARNLAVLLNFEIKLTWGLVRQRHILFCCCC